MKIIGRNPVMEALVAKAKLKKIYINQEAVIDAKLESILDLAKKQNVPVSYKTKRFLNKLADNPMHQGVLAIKKDSEQISLNQFLQDIESSKGLDSKAIEPNSHPPFLLYIRDAYNEFNVGAIIRSAEACGVDAVILPPKLEITSNMVRSAMGATEHIKIINENLFQTIKQVRDLGYKIVGIEISGEKYYYESDLTGPIMLIVGGEDKSLS